MTFHGHRLELSHRRGDTIVFTVHGSESWQEGEYTNERNKTVEYTVSIDEAEAMYDKLGELIRNS